MDKELANEIEKVLKTCRQRGRISMTKDSLLLTQKAIHEAESRGWLVQSNSYTYRLSPVGIEVVECGSVENYLSSFRNSRLTKIKVTKPPTPYAIKHSPTTSPILKFWWKIIAPIIVGIIVGIIILIISKFF